MLADKKENVSELRDYGLYEDIIAFLEEFDQKSNDKRQTRNNKEERSGTRISYEKNIREFFKIVLGKEIEHLTEEDLNIKKREVINYRKQLQDNGNSNSTVNQKMASIKSLYQFLNGEHNVNPSIFELKRLDANTVSYGILNQTEAEAFAEVALSEREKPYQKKMMILFAIRSSFRIDEILNVRWNNFEEVNGVYKVSVLGKRGKLVTNAISSKLYNQILELKELNKETKWNGDPEIVFQISEDAVNKMMKRLRKKLNIAPERNIVFHSFRKTAIDWELTTSGSIKMAAQQGNHSSIETTYKHYIDHTRDYTMSSGVRMEEVVDVEPLLENASIEELKEFIKKGDYRLQFEFQKFINNKMNY